jgi:hypothetical protein
MKPYNIAVCLSGEYRTFKECAENIREFYQSDNHNVVFFGHTWTDSKYTKEHAYYGIEQKEVHHPAQLQLQANTLINFENLLIEDKTVANNELIANHISFDECNFGLKKAANLAKPIVYVHMSYSIMMANWLKTKYEVENNMRFDIVVRARHDTFYKPGKKFDEYIPREIHPAVIYGSSNTFPTEYWQHHFNDVLFFGSSRVMNTVCDFYRYYSTGKFWELLDAHWNNPYVKICGYNVCLYKWLAMKNIRIEEVELLFNTYVFRKTAKKFFSLPDDASLIYDVDRKMFT